MKLRTRMLMAFLPLVLVCAAIGFFAGQAARQLADCLRTLSLHSKLLLEETADAARSSHEQSQDRLRDDFQRLADQAARTLNLSHGHLQMALRALAEAAGIEAFLTGPTEDRGAAVRKVERQFLSAMLLHGIDEICLHGPEGGLLLEVHNPESGTPSHTHIFRFAGRHEGTNASARFQIETAISRPDGDEGGPPARLSLAAPLRYRDGVFTTGDGDLLAWLCIAVDLPRFCEPILLRAAGRHIRLLIVDRQGRTLIDEHPEGGQGGAGAAADWVDMAESAAVGGELTIRLAADADDLRRDAALAAGLFSSLRREADFTEQSVEESRRLVRAFHGRFALVLMAVLLLAVGGTLYLAHYITAPIRRLSAVAGRIAAGQLEEAPEATARDEIGDLGRSFDRMRVTLKDHIRHLDRRVQEQTQALRESEQAYRLLFEQMTNGFALHEIVCDELGQPCDYRFLEVNPAFESLTGLRGAAIKGRTAREVMQRIDPFWIETYGRVALTGEPARFDRYFAPLKRHFEVIAFSPRKGLFAALFNDITERLRNEDESRKLHAQMLHTQKLESLGVLAGGIAHDFNNLLTVILGNADLALASLPPDGDALPSLHRIQNAAQSAAELCRQLLAYAGKGRFARDRIDLNRLINDMGQLLQVSLGRGAVLRYNLAENLPGFEGDPSQLRQVVMNLLTNASDAIGASSGIITVTTGVETLAPGQTSARDWAGPELPAGTYISLQISDTGCGMDRSTLERIFDPFFTTKATGRGLGLAAVIGIVRSHRGGIRVYSEAGEGTTFKILLPPCDHPGDQTGEPPSAPASWKGSGTILVVDDEGPVREILTGMLRILGYSVAPCDSGTAALHLFRKNPRRFTAVLMDLSMPGMNGEECFQALREIDPDVRVILTSGYGQDDVLRRFAGFPVAGFLQKPVSLAQLTTIMRGIGEQEKS